MNSGRYQGAASLVFLIVKSMDWSRPPFYPQCHSTKQHHTLLYANFYARIVHLGPGEIFGSFFFFFFFHLAYGSLTEKNRKFGIRVTQHDHTVPQVHLGIHANISAPKGSLSHHLGNDSYILNLSPLFTGILLNKVLLPFTSFIHPP